MYQKTLLSGRSNVSGVNWNHVYYFSLVASFGSVKLAAQSIGLSPSTLSEQISQLEKSLQVPLFERHGPRLVLTDAGKKLYLHAKEMFERGQRLLDVVSPLRLGCYPVKVGLVPGHHISLATQILTEYLREYGPMNLNIQNTNNKDVEALLLDSQLDFALSNQQPKRKELIFRKISSSKIKFYVSSKWSDKTLEEVADEIPLLVCRSEAGDHEIENALHEIGIFPQSVVAAEYFYVLLDLCKSGLGIGAFSEEAIKRHNISSIQSLKTPRNAPTFETNLYLLWPKGGENTEAITQLLQLPIFKNK